MVVATATVTVKHKNSADERTRGFERLAIICMITDDEEGGTPTATATAGRFGGDGQPRSGQNLAAAGLHC